jgi:hypothetical protein
MGQIVEFSRPRRERVPHARAVIAGPAQILFFTGVRYTRYARESDMPLAVSPACKGKPRDCFNAVRDKRTKPS